MLKKELGISIGDQIPFEYKSKHFVNISENEEYNKQIIGNLPLIRELAKGKGRNFIHRTDKLNNKIDYDFSYYFCAMSLDGLNEVFFWKILK